MPDGEIKITIKQKPGLRHMAVRAISF